VATAVSSGHTNTLFENIACVQREHEAIVRTIVLVSLPSVNLSHIGSGLIDYGGNPIRE